MIIGEVIEDILFKHNVGDKLVECGLMSHIAIRNYQIWIMYRSIVPKTLQEDMTRKEKAEALKNIMIQFKIKNKQTVYDAINMMEEQVKISLS